MVSSSHSILYSTTTSSFPVTSSGSSSSRTSRTFLTPRNSFKPLASSSSLQALEDGSSSAEKFSRSTSIGNFVRFKSGTGNSELQTAVVTYRKKFPWPPLQAPLQVDLISTIHIADKEYFETLQNELGSYDCVLYEMVASRERLENRGNPAAEKKLKTSLPSWFNVTGLIRKMARVLMLEFQSDCLVYDTENWHHADLDFETFKLLQGKKGEGIFTFAINRAIKSTKAMTCSTSVQEDLSTVRSKLLWASRFLPMPLVGRLIISGVCTDVGTLKSNFPELEALSRLDFGTAMKLFWAKRLASKYPEGMSDVEDDSVILGERNKVAIDVLRRAIKDGENKIAILYGGGHMPDLGRRLREDFDLVPSRVKWVTAWSMRNREFTSRTIPFLKKMAEISGWPLNRYQTLALLMFSSVLAVDLLFWKIIFGFTAKYLSQFVSGVLNFVNKFFLRC